MIVVDGGQPGRVTLILMISGVSYGIGLRFDDQRRNQRLVAELDQGTKRLARRWRRGRG